MYLTTTTINGTIFETIENKDPRFFKDIKVWGAEPDRTNTNAEIDNLNITTFYNGAAECDENGLCACTNEYYPSKNGFVNYCHEKDFASKEIFVADVVCPDDCAPESKFK